MPVAIALASFFMALAVAAWSGSYENAKIGEACVAAGSEWVSTWRGYECRQAASRESGT